MTSPLTRSLLAALLLLGQMAGLLHALEHPGVHGHPSENRSGTLLAEASLRGWREGRHAHPHDRADLAAAEHGTARFAGTPPPSKRDGALCGSCLLAAANIALPGTASALRTPMAGDPDVVSITDDAMLPARRSSPHRARGPPATFS